MAKSAEGLTRYERAVANAQNGGGRVISRRDLCTFMRERFSEFLDPALSESSIVYHAVGGGFAVEFDGKLFLMPLEEVARG